MNEFLETPVEELIGVGKKVAEKLDRLKIKKAGDFITHFPHRYEDFSNIKDVVDLAPFPCNFFRKY